MQLSNVSNKPICALSHAPAIFPVQIKFKAATYCHASLLIWVSPLQHGDQSLKRHYHYGIKALPTTSNHYFSLALQLLVKTLQLLKSRYENRKTLQFKQLNVHKTQHAKKK